MLKAEGLRYAVGNKEIIRGISLDFMPGQVSVIIGPNGSGKSTFIRLISGEMKPTQGTVHYGDLKVSHAHLAELARFRAVLTQHSELSFPLTVEEVVMMGRYPHFRNAPSAADKAICNQVIARLKLEDFRYRNYLNLSGGEKQRVHFARVLTQLGERQGTQQRYLLLDEPVSYLDINYQHEFMKIAQAISWEKEIVIAVLHDINLAIQYANRIIALKDGQVIADGSPQDIISAALMQELYGIACRIIRLDNNMPLVVPV